MEEQEESLLSRTWTGMTILGVAWSGSKQKLPVSGSDTMGGGVCQTPFRGGEVVCSAPVGGGEVEYKSSFSGGGVVSPDPSRCGPDRSYDEGDETGQGEPMSRCPPQSSGRRRQTPFFMM